MHAHRSEAFVYHRPGDVRLEAREITCGPRDLVVKVLASARCGTDKTIYRKGHYKVDSNAPIVLGHELVAEIVEVGAQARTLHDGIGYRAGETLGPEYTDFRTGERVTLQSRIARYRDGLMLLTDPITILSFQIDGGYSQYMRVPEALIRSGSVLRVPNAVSDEEGALVEPAACALESIFATPHAVGVDAEGRHLYRSGIRRGGRVCVIGSGTVSMIYALLCTVEGAAEVFMLVRSEEKAQLVRRVLGPGVHAVIIPRYGDRPLAEKLEAERGTVEELRAHTRGELFDDVIAACADPDAQRLMLQLYRPEGYAVGACFGGTHETVDAAELDTNHYRCAKTIGTSGCSTRGMETILRWLQEGRLSLRGFTARRRFTLHDDPHEFLTTQAEGLKPVLYPWE